MNSKDQNLEGRMEKCTKKLPEFDSNRALDYLHHIENEIKRAEQTLAYLESKTASNQDHIAYRRMRGSLRKYLNVLYQAHKFLSRHVPLLVIEQFLTRLISLQAVFKKYAAVFRNISLAVELFTQGADVLVFLVDCVYSALMAKSKEQDKESTGIFDSDCCLKEKAKSLYISSDYSIAPLSTLTTYPFFPAAKKWPSERDDDRDKDMKSTNDDTNNEAEALPCDDVSGNSKSTISLKTNERTSDEAASTLSTSTPAEHLQHNQNEGEVVDETSLATSVPDTSSHTLVDDMHFSSGQTLPPSTPLSVLELETKRTIASFNDTGELPITIQQQDSQPDSVPPSGPVVNAVQESNGQNDTNKMMNTYQPTDVAVSEEKFILSPRNH